MQVRIDVGRSSPLEDGQSFRVFYGQATNRTVILSRPPFALEASTSAWQAVSSADWIAVPGVA